MDEKIEFIEGVITKEEKHIISYKSRLIKQEYILEGYEKILLDLRRLKEYEEVITEIKRILEFETENVVNEIRNIIVRLDVIED
jgi:hypothetical protein